MINGDPVFLGEIAGPRASVVLNAFFFLGSLDMLPI